MSKDKKEESSPWWKRTAYTAIIFAVGGWGFDYLQEEFDAYKDAEDAKWAEQRKTLTEIKFQQNVIQHQQEAIWQATSDNNKKLEQVKADQDFQKYVTAYQQRLIENTHRSNYERKLDNEEPKVSEEVKTLKDVSQLSPFQKAIKAVTGTAEEKKLIKEYDEQQFIKKKIKELAVKPDQKIDDKKEKEKLKREYLQQQRDHALKELKK